MTDERPDPSLDSDRVDSGHRHGGTDDSRNGDGCDVRHADCDDVRDRDGDGGRDGDRDDDGDGSAARLGRDGVLVAMAVLAMCVGIVVGTVSGPQVPPSVAPYLPIAVVAALDAVFGGVRAFLDGIFDSKVFVVSFVFNVLVAALIVWLGDQLGVGTQLSTAIVVVLGIRIFGNAAALRRRLLGA